MKSFKHWTRQDIQNEFGLNIKDQCDDLNYWLANKMPLNEHEKAHSTVLKERLNKYADVWNEQELIIKFISFLIDFANYDTNDFKTFANRKLQGEINGKQLNGEVDLMVASGEFEPQAPYFCLHEFKKDENLSKDPLGQLIIAMLTAQAINNDNLPIYGAYVSGRNWFFLTLVGNAYCKSRQFDASSDDIFEIVQILKGLKPIIEARAYYSE